MSMKMKKVYVGCSLTHAPKEFHDRIDILKNKLREHYEVLEFIDLTNGTNTDVFLWDTKCVKDSDLFIADCTYPALGLGYEIGVALENNKQTIAIAEKGARVSRLLLGVTDKDYIFHWYKHILDIVPLVEEKLPVVAD